MKQYHNQPAAAFIGYDKGASIICPSCARKVEAPMRQLCAEQVRDEFPREKACNICAEPIEGL